MATSWAAGIIVSEVAPSYAAMCECQSAVIICSYPHLRQCVRCLGPPFPDELGHLLGQLQHVDPGKVLDLVNEPAVERIARHVEELAWRREGALAGHDDQVPLGARLQVVALARDPLPPLQVVVLPLARSE